ncbi:MAG: glycine cleavage system protein GcvH [bacterium]
METPEDLRYSKDHQWIRTEGEEGVVGITDFAQHELTDIVFVELPEVGREVSAGEAMAAVESSKAVSDVYAPVGGSVTAVNDALEDQPELINESPYTDGWMVRLKMSNPDELDGLLSAKEYRELTEN